MTHFKYTFIFPEVKYPFISFTGVLQFWRHRWYWCSVEWLPDR